MVFKMYTPESTSILSPTAHHLVELSSPLRLCHLKKKKKVQPNWPQIMLFFKGGGWGGICKMWSKNQIIQKGVEGILAALPVSFVGNTGVVSGLN